MAYEPSEAARAQAQAARRRDDAHRAAESLTSWAERYGHRIDGDAVRRVLDVAADLRQPGGAYAGKNAVCRKTSALGS